MIAIDENCDARIHAMSLDSIRSNRFLAVGCLAGSLLTATDKPAWGQAADTPQSLSPAEVKMARSVDAHADADLVLLEKLVDLNSGTMHPAGVEAVKDSLAPQFESLGFKVRWVPMQSQTGRAGDLIAEHLCPAGEGQCGEKLLLIGHMDTVFEPSSSFQHYA